MPWTLLAARARSRVRRGSIVRLLARALVLAGLTAGLSGCQRASAPHEPVHLSIGYANRLTNGTYGGLPALLGLLENVRLISATQQGGYEPALAERWEQSADGLTWTFLLPPRLTFQDGTRLDAAIVAATLRERMTAGSRPGLRDILSIEAKDARTFVIHLRHPSSFLLDALASESIRSPGEKSSGAGAYRIERQAQGNATLVAFPGYYRGKPAIDHVEFRSYEDARKAWSAMMRGDIDVLYEVTSDAMEFIEGSSATQVRSFLRPYVYAMGLNLKHPILGKRDVRIALSQAVNRDDIVKGAFGSKGEPAVSPFMPRHWAVDPSAPAYRYAPVEARKLLDAAGLPVKAAGARQMPSRLRFKCLVPADRAPFEMIGLMLQRQLIEVGIDMELEALPPTALVQRVSSGDYEAFLSDMASLNFEWGYMMWHSPEPGTRGLIASGYQAADEVFDRLRVARTEDEIRAAARAVQRTMYEDPPAVFLGWARMARAVNGRFQLPAVPERDIIQMLPLWRPLGPGERLTAAPAPAPTPTSALSP